MTAATSLRVDVGALAGDAVGRAHDRLARALATTLRHLEEDDRPLDELQQATLFAHIFAAFDGFERELASYIVAALRRDAVEVWGLPTELEDLVDA